MKAKMDEIWTIYRRNLGQNSRWNINLPLKINFGRWINTNVIWAVRSRCMKEGIYLQKINDLSPKYRRFIAARSDFSHKIVDLSLPTDISAIFWRYFHKYLPLIFLHEISCRPLLIHYILVIYRRYIPTFSSLHEPFPHFFYIFKLLSS